MKLLTLSMLIASATAGLVLGWQLKTREALGNSVSSEGAEDESSRKRAEKSPEVGRRVPAARLSPDTAAALHALPTEELYDRMSLFLIDAKAGDFPAFYEELQKRSDRSSDLNDLLFIAWTRVDPEAAVAASRGTHDFKYAYWAWACHDPGGALASALEKKEGVRNAVWGIGEFHPGWLKENRDLIPEDQRSSAIQGLLKWPNTESPEVTLRLLYDSKNTYYSEANELTLLALARQDPAHAYELIKELTGDPNDYQSLQTLDSFIASLSRYEPALLGEIAAVTKSPIDKNKIQLAQFKGLLREDPGSAKAMLENTPKSWLKDDLGITYASHLLVSDPERGFEHAVNFLKNDFGDSNRYTQIKTKNGSSGSGNADAGSGQLISNLLNQDAPALLNGLLPGPDRVGRNDAFYKASSAWAANDVGAYAEWLGGHRENPAIYEAGASDIVDVLQNKGEFEIGMEWAESIPVAEGETSYHMSRLYNTWQRKDPEGASAWRLSDRFTGNPEHFPLPKTIEVK